MNLSDLIARNAAFTPDKPALIFEGETLTYRAFYDRIDRVYVSVLRFFEIGSVFRKNPLYVRE